MSEQSIAAGFARALADLAVAKGAARGELLRRAGIAAANLDDQDNRIPVEKYKALMRAGQELANDPALALHFGETYDMAELSIVGLLAQSAESAAQVSAELGRYLRLIADIEVEGPGERLVFTQIDNALWLVDRRKNPNEFPEITESSFARMVTMTRRTGKSGFIKAVRVTHPAPSYRSEYDRIFEVPVTFDSGMNALEVEASLFEFEPPLPSRYVFGILSARADALLKELENAKTVRGRVESLLIPILHTGKTSVDVIARKMAMSRQTLFRRLKAEGTNFETVLDDLRHRMALDYLSARKVSVNETAYLVGFSDPAAFSRAFKRWTGTRPGRHRDSL